MIGLDSQELDPPAMAVTQVDSDEDKRRLKLRRVGNFPDCGIWDGSAQFRQFGNLAVLRQITLPLGDIIGKVNVVYSWASWL
jgi:hypothetical protein